MQRSPGHRPPELYCKEPEIKLTKRSFSLSRNVLSIIPWCSFVILKFRLCSVYDINICPLVCKSIYWYIIALSSLSTGQQNKTHHKNSGKTTIESQHCKDTLSYFIEENIYFVMFAEGNSTFKESSKQLNWPFWSNEHFHIRVGVIRTIFHET